METHGRPIALDFSKFKLGTPFFVPGTRVEAMTQSIAKEMKRRRLTKLAMAARMKTSRAALDRLLDPDNPSVTIGTLEKAATALNRRLTVELR